MEALKRLSLCWLLAEELASLQSSPSWGRHVTTAGIWGLKWPSVLPEPQDRRPWAQGRPLQDESGPALRLGQVIFHQRNLV